MAKFQILRATGGNGGIPSSRREFLQLALSAGVSWTLLPVSVKAAALPQVALFDWGLAETLLSIGVTPIALAETGGYRKWVLEPELPDQVIDLGLRLAPNFELLASLRPDLIITTPEIHPLHPMLEKIAPTKQLSIYRPDGKAWDHSRQCAVEMGRLLGVQQQTDDFLRQVDATLSATRQRIDGKAQRPVYLVTFIDHRHVRIFGANSIFQTVLERLGLTNAFTGWTNYWGFTTRGIEHLAEQPDAQLIYIEPAPKAALETMTNSPLWHALPFVRSGHVKALPPVWSFGGLASGVRLARLLGKMPPEAATNTAARVQGTL